MIRPISPKRAQAHVSLRRFTKTDAQASYRVFFDAVHRGTGQAYSVPERIAWASSDRMPPSWIERLSEQFTIVAMMEGRLVGFMAMDDAGHVDMAFVQPNVVRQGIARKIYTALENEAIQRGLTRLTTEASLIAEPFFTAMGWEKIADHACMRNGIALRNARMAKPLTRADSS